MPHSTLLSRPQFSIAVAGATGVLGFVVTETLLTVYKQFFPHVIALTRDASSEKARALADSGAEVVQVPLGDNKGPMDENVRSELLKALKNVDIVVNVLGSTSLAVKNVIAATAIEAGAKVYFPTEFGIDNRLNDFPGYEHGDWIKKRKHVAYAADLAAKKAADVKVIVVYTGLFPDDSFNVLGVDFTTRTITTFGPSSARTTYTSKPDIACSVAQLSILAMLSPTSLPDSVAPHIRIAGCTRSAAEIARVLSSASSGGAGFVLKEEDIAPVKARMKKEYEEGDVPITFDYLRSIMGEGKLDFSTDNDNDLVNPKERFWKWTTVEQTTKELLG